MDSHTDTQRKTAPVSGFARSFISGKPIANAIITIIEDGTQLSTDNEGKFGPFEWPVGKPVTLELKKEGSLWTGYQTTQTATLVVPDQGINDPWPLKNISFQVPSNIAIKLFTFAMGVKEDKEACYVVATITPPDITMDDSPQGEAGVTASLYPDPRVNTFYFGIFPLIHKTNPFSRKLAYTSEDGGIAFTNIPEGTYTLKAKKDNLEFTEVTIKARKGVLVNASPPRGPIMISPRQKHTAYFQQNNHCLFFKPAVIGVASTLGYTFYGVSGALVAGYLSYKVVDTISEYYYKK